MADLTIQKVTVAGVDFAAGFVAAAGGGDTIPANPGRALLWVKNGGGSSINVTITQTAKCSFGDHATSLVVAVPAAGERAIGPLAKNRFDDASGEVQIAYSAVTSVTVKAVEIA